MSVQQLITEHLDIWTAAHKTRSSAGRGSSSKLDLVGIKKLRELILELAVRGKLVPQDPNDEPTSELLKRIAAEKEKLIEKGLIKKEKLLAEIDEATAILDFPKGWQVVHLQKVCSYIQRGKGPKYADYGQVRVVSQKCIQWAGFDVEQARHVNDESLSAYKEERYLQNDDLLWNSTGTGTVGRVAVLAGVRPETLVADSHVTVIRPIEVCSRFLCTYISAPGVQNRIEPGSENALVSGTTNQVELNTSSVMSVEVPIPPIEEQHRIVAKVDELMAFCDQLEQAQTNDIAAHAQLVEALLASLINCADHKELQSNWQRIAAHFDTLFTTEHSIDQLKQTILQLAVMGKLVPQNPNDEPASVLLKKIAKEKEQLIKERKIKKQKPLPEITEEEKPFELPSGWAITRFYEVSHLITDGAHHTPTYIESGIPFLSVKDMSNGKISFEDTRYISAEQHEELSKRCHPQKGDLLLTKIGTTGVPVLIDTEIEFSIFVSVALIKFPAKYISGEFLSLLIKSPFVKIQSEEGTQGVGNKNLVLKTIAAFMLAIPPLAEQHRIVAKVEELITLCDTLKTNLQNAQTTQLALAECLVEQSVN